MIMSKQIGYNIKTPKKIEQMIVNDYINNHLGSSTLSDKYDLTCSTILRIIERNGYTVRTNREKSLKNHCDSHYFDIIDTEEKAYWLGFLLADGYVAVRGSSCITGLGLAERDKGHIEKLKIALNATHNIRTYVASGYSSTLYCRIIFTDPILTKRLISLGVVEHKTNIVSPPHNIPDNLTRHCLRGYFDGNGSIAIKKANKIGNKPVYCAKITSTESILDWFLDYANKNGINIKRRYYKRKNYQIVSTVDIGGNIKAQAFLDLLYKGSHIYLDRKYQRYQDLCKLNTVVPIRKDRVKELQNAEISIGI